MRATIFYGLPLRGSLWEIHAPIAWAAPRNNLTMKERVMIKCSICNAELTKQEAGDTAFIASYQAAGHPFLCNRCIDNAIKGESNE
jgi:hypothetical protein